MKKVMGYGLWVMGLIIFLSFYQASEGASEQKAPGPFQKAPDSFSWDFGRVKEGAILKHDFIFKNESKAVLTVKSVATSCGCTVSEAKKKTLLPQESTLLAVQFNTNGYSGPVKQYVYVTTNSLDTPVVKFIIKAEVAKGGK